MKRLLLVIACVLVLSGPAGAVTTFDFVQLETYNVVAWTTKPDINRYYLGVSSDPKGTLLGLDSSGKLNPLLEIGSVYYLYAGNLDVNAWQPNSWHMLYHYTDYVNSGGGSPLIRADFYVTGSPGSFSLWNNFQTYYVNGIVDQPSIYLGWAQGTADLVSPKAFTGDGVNDIYLVLGIGVEPKPVPLPGAVWLLGTGLMGLIGLRRKLRG